jgi:thiol-disulfide isomerase/thioredoxin
VSAEWCGPCKEEANDLPQFYTELYQPRGARFLAAMIEDKAGDPADQPTVDRWVNAYRTNFDIVADPDGLSMLDKGDPNWSIPRNYIVNTRDMKIYRVNLGVRVDATRVDGLKTILDYNGAPPGPASLDAGTTTTTDAGTTPDTGASG